MHTRPNAHKVWTLPRECCSCPGVCVAIQDRNVYAINSVLTFHEHRSTNCGALIDTKPCCPLSKPLGSLLLPCKTQTTKSLPRQWSKVCRTYSLLAALGRAGESAATEAGGRLAVVDAVDCLGLVGDHLLQVLARSLDRDLQDRVSERAISLTLNVLSSWTCALLTNARCLHAHVRVGARGQASPPGHTFGQLISL